MAGVGLRYNNTKKEYQEVGEPGFKERELTPEKLTEMIPFIEQMVAQLLILGEGEEKRSEKEKIVLEYLDKARVEKGNFGWANLVPYYFLEEKDNVEAQYKLNVKESIRRWRDETFQEVRSTIPILYSTLFPLI